MSNKKAEARARLKAMREEQARKDRRRERMMRYGIALAVVAAVAIIAVAVVASRGDDGPTAVPVNVNEGRGQDVADDSRGIFVGDEAAPVTIDYWMDFRCPHCKTFEDANGQAIQELIDAGEANIVYHPLTFTGGDYSGRANNAFACASDEGMATEFKRAAFAAPAQWSTGDLVDLGEANDIGGDYESCVRDRTYEDWSTNVTRSARDLGVTGTPAVFVNGEQLPETSWTPEGIRAAVEAAAGESAPSTQGPAPSGPPTPGAEATP